MFCAVISPVQVSTCPVVSELALGFSASEPVEASVHCIQLFWDDGVIRHTCSGGVICREGGILAVANSFLVKSASSLPFILR